MNRIEKKIAIYGGSFDPPTIAHLQVAAEIYNKVKDIDEVWIIPCGDFREDKHLNATAKQRIEMLEFIKEDIFGDSFPNIIISDYELKSGKYLPTYNLLCGLKKHYPNYEFYMCVGADLISGMKSWDEGERLYDENKFIVITRRGYEYDKKDLPQDSHLLEIDIYGSSTLLRNRIRINNHDKISNIYGLTSKSCIIYINKNHLYQ